MPRIDKKTVEYGWRWLNNPLRLRESILVNLPAIQDRVLAGQGNLSSAYILHDLITAAATYILAIQTTDRDLQDIQTFLRLSMEQPDARLILPHLSCSKATFYRRVKPNAISLLAEQLQAQLS